MINLNFWEVLKKVSESSLERSQQSLDAWCFVIVMVSGIRGWAVGQNNAIAATQSHHATFLLVSRMDCKVGNHPKALQRHSRCSLGALVHAGVTRTLWASSTEPRPQSST